LGDGVLKDTQKGEFADALYFTAPGKVEVERARIDPGAGDLVVDSELMGISHGTEMLMYRGDFPKGIPSDETLETLDGELRYPLKYGYVNVGRTQQGRSVFCFYPHQTRFSVPAGQCIFLPEDIKPRDAVFLASMETAVGIIQDAHPRFGETVLIVGQGVIGLLCAAILCRFHYGTVITVDPYEKRRKASEALGCISFDPGTEATLFPKKGRTGIPAPDEGLSIEHKPSAGQSNRETKENILAGTEGRGIDTAINVSGSSRGLQLAIDTLAREGTLIEGSWYGNKKAEIELGSSFHRKRLTIRSSQVSTVDPALAPRWDKNRRLYVVMDCLRTLRPAQYITHEFKLRDAEKAFALIFEHPEETIQVVLVP
jgi:threonine dehydrogenase-like Zn-dependent dehydrogenase